MTGSIQLFSRQNRRISQRLRHQGRQKQKSVKDRSINIECPNALALFANFSSKPGFSSAQN
jgi:hypothetical protein